MAKKSPKEAAKKLIFLFCFAMYVCQNVILTGEGEELESPNVAQNVPKDPSYLVVKPSLT